MNIITEHKTFSPYWGKIVQKSKPGEMIDYVVYSGNIAYSGLVDKEVDKELRKRINILV